MLHPNLCLDDPVGILHANITREKVKDVEYFLTPEQKLYPAKHHIDGSRPSSVHRFPTKPTNNCK